MFLSLLLTIPGFIAMGILAYQNLDYLTGWYSDFAFAVKDKVKFHFGVFHDVDSGIFPPYIFFSTTMSGFTTYSSTIGVNTLYSSNMSISSSTITSANGQDLVFSNSSKNISLNQLASAIDEIRLARQEICELKVKYGKRIHELEELLKENKKC